MMQFLQCSVTFHVKYGTIYTYIQYSCFNVVSFTGIRDNGSVWKIKNNFQSKECMYMNVFFIYIYINVFDVLIPKCFNWLTPLMMSSPSRSLSSVDAETRNTNHRTGLTMVFTNWPIFRCERLHPISVLSELSFSLIIKKHLFLQLGMFSVLLEPQKTNAELTLFQYGFKSQN